MTSVQQHLCAIKQKQLDFFNMNLFEQVMLQVQKYVSTPGRNMIKCTGYLCTLENCYETKASVIEIQPQNILERSAFSDNFIWNHNYTCQTKKQQFCRICEKTLTKLQSKTHISAQKRATLHRVEIR